jgi:hypothetical protein
MDLTHKEYTLYEEITHVGDRKEHIRLYELDCKLFYSYIVVTPHGAHRHYRPASLEDHAVATQALVEQLSRTETH